MYKKEKKKKNQTSFSQASEKPWCRGVQKYQQPGRLSSARGFIASLHM